MDHRDVRIVEHVGRTVIRIPIADDGPEGPLSPEPDGICADCGARDTVARATHQTTPPVVYRFCRDCWPAARDRFEAAQEAARRRWRARQQARWHERLQALLKEHPEAPTSARLAELRRDDIRDAEPAPAGYSLHSRSWYDVVVQVERLEAMQVGDQPGVRPRKEDQLARIAALIQSYAPRMDGPMPPSVAAFIQCYVPPAG